uniref:Riboflavin biosynthesis protein RibD n=1 Tax=Candidatus Kentrum sp. MB TaxID=2138164 RepID=A0A450XWM1_9GAMM|nr:MAG: diaminohydroxyphosphoribosylaminopyrimidine deaminase / 5-amino-6-(5-phosphoribosylamino)uracil reductase [Candidatus Kentron sp. MB]VFK33672.1 MAG: diaminohydroxyphosphoribosylaminopyrimidine deaminase / 5-amino-6-(5-phosphoribosylamino)uracil reductase [Candidatus Kentron sp. MB]VFK76290.1 MAG: diaminohydroxyphosphoribosylaminopyrimidine deaminase / 5-amino-6-(5-phosphoribosylamino)uracil reductase [Candidatus Kentron sp. MB]
MARALQLARCGLNTTHPNPRVGCVLAREGKIVGEGWHEFAGKPHAERNALAQAGDLARSATAYVTLEPCCHFGRTDPCVTALIKAGIRRVVGAITDPNPQVSGQGFAELSRAGVVVETGLLASEAAKLNSGFIMRMKHGRPFVRCKLAMSLDGRTAMSSGESQWITGSAARRDVQRLRAQSSVILTGLGTVVADDPSLTLRPEEFGIITGKKPIRQPLRVVLDPQLAISPQAIILQPAIAPITVIACSGQHSRDRAKLFRKRGITVAELPGDGSNIHLASLMDYLATEEINEVLLESGARLAGAMLRQGLLDELIIYLAPTIMGSSARALFDLPEIRRMAHRYRLEITDMRAVGEDWRITARFVRK